MYKFTGDWNILAEKGFTQDANKTFWFLPKMPRNHAIIVDASNRIIECSYDDDLDIIRDNIEFISWDEFKKLINS